MANFAHDITVTFDKIDYSYCITNEVWFNVDFGVISNSSLKILISHIGTQMTEYEKVGSDPEEYTGEDSF